MKILYITTVGTTMRFFESLIKEMLDAKHTIDIATNENDGEAHVPECYRKWGCKVYPISCSRSPLHKGNRKAIREIKKLVIENKYDNLNGIINNKQIGNYEEGIYMMKFNELRIIKDHL